MTMVVGKHSTMLAGWRVAQAAVRCGGRLPGGSLLGGALVPARRLSEASGEVGRRFRGFVDSIEAGGVIRMRGENPSK
jgi:hypothetical protein